MRSRPALLISLLSLVLCSCEKDATVPVSHAEPEKRDPWKWPYHKTSIWNMPIGEGAKYAPVDLVPTRGVGLDVKHFLELNADDPMRKAIGFDRFAPPQGRCSGTTEMNGLAIPLPDGWLVPDVGPENPYGLKPNSSFVFRTVEGDRAWIGSAIARCDPEGPLYMYSFQRFEHSRYYDRLDGDGLTNSGGQGASGMSGLGGTIRLGEMVSDEPIRHAIKINVWGHHLHYSDDLPGYRWPARAADRYANEEGHKNRYVGDDPNLVMGALLAIPPEVTAEELGLTTEPAKKLLFTLQHYGAYITEDTGWDVLDFIIERDVEVEFEEHYDFPMKRGLWGEEVEKLAAAFHVVVNNGPDSIGGGGEPLQPLAPGLDLERISKDR